MISTSQVGLSNGGVYAGGQRRRIIANYRRRQRVRIMRGLILVLLAIFGLGGKSRLTA